MERLAPQRSPNCTINPDRPKQQGLFYNQGKQWGEKQHINSYASARRSSNGQLVRKTNQIFWVETWQHYKTMCAGYQITELTKMTQSPSSKKNN